MSVACGSRGPVYQGGRPEEMLSARALEVARSCASGEAQEAFRGRLEQRSWCSKARSRLRPGGFTWLKADEAARDLLLSGRAYEQGVRDGYGLANMLAESGCPMAGIARRAHSTNLQGGRL